MSSDPDAPLRHTHQECARLLDHFLLPPADLLAALAPDGWSNSPLLYSYHPTVEQRRQEAADFRENLKGWSQIEPEEVEEDGRPEDAEREVVDLVGHLLWDVFSDNHAVFDGEGDFDLGSFRGSAGFLAEKINTRYLLLSDARDYMDFYMGTIWLGRRADLGPVYRWVFAGLRAAGGDWRYAFPRIYLVAFDRDSAEEESLARDPSAAVAAELEAANRERERAQMQQRLDADYSQAVEQAKRRPAPAIVQAYYDVYGRWPRGWPPARTAAFRTGYNG